MIVAPPTPEAIRALDRELRAGATVDGFLSVPNLRDAVVLAIVRRINGNGPDETDPEFGEQAMALVCAALDERAS